MKDLQALTEKVVAFREARNWKQFHNPKDQALSLVLESTEVLEHFQWKNDQEMAKHIEEEKDLIGEELADVLYWVLLMAHDFGLNLESCFHHKLEKNEEKYPVEKSYGQHTKYSDL